VLPEQNDSTLLVDIPLANRDGVRVLTPDYNLVEHTWTGAGPLGLKFTDHGSQGALVVEEVAPFVPSIIQGTVLKSIGGQDVSSSSYDEVMAQLKAAVRPISLSFQQLHIQGASAEAVEFKGDGPVLARAMSHMSEDSAAPSGLARTYTRHVCSAWHSGCSSQV